MNRRDDAQWAESRASVSGQWRRPSDDQDGSGLAGKIRLGKCQGGGRSDNLEQWQVGVPRLSQARLFRQWKIAPALHLLAIDLDDLLNLFRSQNIAPLIGLAAAKEFGGLGRTFDEALLVFLLAEAIE